MLSGVVVEVGGTGQVSAEAGDAVDDFLAGAHAVEAAGVAAEPEHLPGAGEQPVVAGSDAQGAVFGAAVTAVGGPVGVLGELGVGAGQQCLRGLQDEGLIPFQDQDVVAV
jgi:hypothetical protein